MTDTGLGAAILFGLLAAAGVLLTLFAPSQPLSAIGFGAAIVFGGGVIVVQHWAGTVAASGSH